MRPAAWTLLVSALVVVGGCRDHGTPEDRSRAAAEAYGQLPGLKETPHRELQSELARIIDEKGTPELLAGNEPPAQKNVAAGLRALLKASQVGSIFAESEVVFPPGKFAFDAVGLEKAIRFRKRYDLPRQQARAALKRPECNFGIRYQEGFLADLSFIDVVRLCGRLEAFCAADSLSRSDPDAAIESLRAMLRLASCLAAEKHPTTRFEAAFLRTEALAVLQAIVEHPKTARKHLETLHALIQGELTAWPNDADAWIGDRALGMCAYEVVRAGNLFNLLTEEEIEQFTQEGILDELPAAAQRIANQDELYYLTVMRRIIDSCGQPYYARAEMFEEIRRDLHEKRNSPDFPLVAGRLLLADIEQGHAIQARDRANCEAWSLALALAAGRDGPPYQTNPLTGKKYDVVKQEGLITVWNVGTGTGGDNPPVIVPDLAQPGPEE